jgi:restriction endonuclease S subunit
VESLIGAVPDTWRQARLSEVCNILAGSSTARFKEGAHKLPGIPIVTPRDLRFNRIIHESAAFVSASKAEEMKRYRLKAGDVVCSRTGDLDRRGLTTEEQEGWLLGTACLRLRVSGELNSSYLTYYLGHPKVRDWIIRNAAGSAIPSINTGTFSSMPLVIPPKTIQIGASQALSVLDEKSMIHDQISKASSELRDALLPLVLTGVYALPQG